MLRTAAAKHVEAVVMALAELSAARAAIRCTIGDIDRWLDEMVSDATAIADRPHNPTSSPPGFSNSGRTDV